MEAHHRRPYGQAGDQWRAQLEKWQVEINLPSFPALNTISRRFRQPKPALTVFQSFITDSAWSLCSLYFIQILKTGGSTGGVAVANLAVLGRYALEAGGDVHERVVWELTGPSQPAPSGQAWLRRPVVDIGRQRRRSCRCLMRGLRDQPATGAVTEYKNFAFENVLRFGDRFFGVQNDGIYELTGDTDNGEPIIAKVRTFYTDSPARRTSSGCHSSMSSARPEPTCIGFTADKGCWSWRIPRRPCRTRCPDRSCQGWPGCEGHVLQLLDHQHRRSGISDRPTGRRSSTRQRWVKG